MTWSDLLPAPKGGSTVTAVSVQIFTPAKGRPKLGITIAGTLATEAGIPLDALSKVRVRIGAKENAGRMMVVADPAGPFTAKPMKSRQSVNVTASLPEGAPVKLPAVRVEAVVEGGGVSFAVPWGAPNGTRARTRPAAKGTPQRGPRLPPPPPAVIKDTHSAHQPSVLAPKDADADSGPLMPKFIGVERRGHEFHAAGTMPPTLDAVEEAARPPTEPPGGKIAAGLKEALAVTRGEAGPARTTVVRVQDAGGDKSAAPAVPPPAGAKGLIHDAGKSAAEALDALEEFADKPLNGSAKGHVYADSEDAGAKYEFCHNGKSCRLTKKQYAVVNRLYDLMLKNKPGSFLSFDTLIKASASSSKEVMQAVVSAARKPIAPLGLAIKPWTGMGYWMEEARS